MIQTKVRQIGNSLGIVIPKELLDKLGLEKGDSLSLSANTEGFSATMYDEEVSRQLNFAKEATKQYREALRELAK